MVLRHQGPRVAPPEAEIPVQDDKAVEDRGGEVNASRNVHVQTWQLRARGRVLPKSIVSGQYDSLVAAQEKFIGGYSEQLQRLEDKRAGGEHSLGEYVSLRITSRRTITLLMNPNNWPEALNNLDFVPLATLTTA